MNKIYINLKRFDILSKFGGINRDDNVNDWAERIITEIEKGITKLDDISVTVFFPEAHLLNANKVAKKIIVGCQGVYAFDTARDGNFGAFTSKLTANAAKSMNVCSTIIGHCEEKNALRLVLNEVEVVNEEAICKVLNKEMLCAQKAELDILYCIGEKEDETNKWEDVLLSQLAIGLKGINQKNVTIAYEPIWSIGPGKQAASSKHIIKVISLIKENYPNLKVVYGGGLKDENVVDIASIRDIDGGLIALTRFVDDIGFYPNEFAEIVRKYIEVRK